MVSAIAFSFCLPCVDTVMMCWQMMLGIGWPRSSLNFHWSSSHVLVVIFCYWVLNAILVCLQILRQKTALALFSGAMQNCTLLHRTMSIFIWLIKVLGCRYFSCYVLVWWIGQFDRYVWFWLASSVVSRLFKYFVASSIRFKVVYIIISRQLHVDQWVSIRINCINILIMTLHNLFCILLIKT